MSLIVGHTLDVELVALAGEELGALDFNGRNSRYDSAQARQQAERYQLDHLAVYRRSGLLSMWRGCKRKCVAIAASKYQANALARHKCTVNGSGVD